MWVLVGITGKLGLELAGKCGGWGVITARLGLELAGTCGGWVWGEPGEYWGLSWRVCGCWGEHAEEGGGRSGIGI